MYGGVFVVALSLLIREILLTRLFSVSLFYHFAFMTVSIAMFGMTIGALAVILYPRFFPPEKFQALLGVLLGRGSRANGLRAGAGFYTYDQRHGPDHIRQFYLGNSLFLSGGICLSLILARCRKSAGKLLLWI